MITKKKLEELLKKEKEVNRKKILNNLINAAACSIKGLDDMTSMIEVAILFKTHELNDSATKDKEVISEQIKFLNELLLLQEDLILSINFKELDNRLLQDEEVTQDNRELIMETLYRYYGRS